MWLETNTGSQNGYGAPSSTLRHSASFSCLLRNGMPGTENPHRSRTATLSTADADYGFVARRNEKLRSGFHCAVLEEETGEEDDQAKKQYTNSFRDSIKKSASLLSPTIWWSPKSRRDKSEKPAPVEKGPEHNQKRWRSLGALLRVSNSNSGSSQPPSSPRAQSFYLLDDFLKPTDHRHQPQKRNYVKSTVNTNSSSDSLELSSPVPPPVPPPPPPLKYAGYKSSCDCSHCKYSRKNEMFGNMDKPRGDGREGVGTTYLSSKTGGKATTSKGKSDKRTFELPAVNTRSAFNFARITGSSANLVDTRVSLKGKTTIVEIDKSPPPIAILQPTVVTVHVNGSGQNLPRVHRYQSSRRNDEAPAGSSSGSDAGGQLYGGKTTRYKDGKVEKVKIPMTSQEALDAYGDYLTAYEKREIQSYKEVWFVGMNANKIRGGSGDSNYGYDDENGNYNKVMHDQIAYRYEVLEVLGKGSFGQVVRAFDHKRKEHVAIKIIRNKKRFFHQAQVEVLILEQLRKQDKNEAHNIIRMEDHFYFRSHLCITFELMYMNLYEVIKKNGYHGFDVAVVQKYAYSLVQCLKLLYKENIIHCDLKPENILLQRENSLRIKVIDFGSSCYVHQKVYTYIQSRFYRSPEVILGLPYDKAIDMWSFGCILAELNTGYPLFPGENEVEQLACIMEVLGLPSHDVIMRSSRRRLFFDLKGVPRSLTNSKQRKRRPGSIRLMDVLKTDNELFLDFISRCLMWDPEKRMTPDEALKHDWLRMITDRRSFCENSKEASSFCSAMVDTNTYFPSVL